ncbi:hypothetical protein B0H17DRAFT_1126822 [Mycena rosella]|uniref:Uncharacterized protein n=1 Tax=Mycena rosella TaxID=1033263 RepID=A0AAD7M7D6_MYCRO|nr:hypothetical protein B0H17DRAFT_1126822 [Mycena rosella]
MDGKLARHMASGMLELHPDRAMRERRGIMGSSEKNSGIWSVRSAGRVRKRLRVNAGYGAKACYGYFAEADEGANIPSVRCEARSPGRIVPDPVAYDGVPSSLIERGKEPERFSQVPRRVRLDSSLFRLAKCREIALQRAGVEKEISLHLWHICPKVVGERTPVGGGCLG